MIVTTKTEEGKCVEHIVWMDERQHIVSFHKVDGYRRCSFFSAAAGRQHGGGRGRHAGRRSGASPILYYNN